MDKCFFSIYKTFFKIGLLLLGGGYVILPLLTSELSEKKRWLSSDELCEYYAISSSLPGIIAINTSIFTGRKLLGFKGEIAAISGIITPAFIAIIILASLMEEVLGFSLVKYAFWGIGISIITLLFMAVKEMWCKCVTDKYTLFVYFVVLFISLFSKISPAWIIIFTVIFALVHQFVLRRNDAR